MDGSFPINVYIYFDNSHRDLLSSTVTHHCGCKHSHFFFLSCLKFWKSVLTSVSVLQHQSKALIVVLNLKNRLLPIMSINIISYAHMYLYMHKYIYIFKCKLTAFQMHHLSSCLKLCTKRDLCKVQRYKRGGFSCSKANFFVSSYTLPQVHTHCVGSITKHNRCSAALKVRGRDSVEGEWGLRRKMWRDVAQAARGAALHIHHRAHKD